MAGHLNKIYITYNVLAMDEKMERMTNSFQGFSKKQNDRTCLSEKF